MARLLRGVCLIALAISVFGFSLLPKEMPEFDLAVDSPLPTLSPEAQTVLGEQLYQYEKAVDNANSALSETLADGLSTSRKYKGAKRDAKKVAEVMDELFKSSDAQTFRNSLQAQGFFEAKFIKSLKKEDIENIREVYKKYGPSPLDVDSIAKPNLFANTEEGVKYADNVIFRTQEAKLTKALKNPDSPTWWEEFTAKIEKLLSSLKGKGIEYKAAQVAKLAEKVKIQTDLVNKLCWSNKHLSKACADHRDEVASIKLKDQDDLDAWVQDDPFLSEAQLKDEATKYVNWLWDSEPYDIDEAAPKLSSKMEDLFEESGEKDENKFMEDYFLKTAQESVDKKYKAYKEYKILPESDTSLTFKAWNKLNDDSVANDDDNQINDEDGPLANDVLTDEEMDGLMNTELTVEGNEEGAKVFDEAVSERADAAASKFVENGVFELGTVFADGTAIGGESATDMLKDEMGGMLEKLATKVV